MRRQQNKAVTREKKSSNRELIRINLSQNHGFLFIGFVSKFINDLKTHQGGEKKMRWLRKETGQSTLEYVIVLTAIIAAIILALPVIRDRVQQSYEHAASEMSDQVGKINY